MPPQVRNPARLRLARADHGWRPAFTLVELLVVMAILVLAFGMITPAVVSTLRGRQLTGTANQVVATLNLARQTALAQNIAVEVRLYAYADPTAPGESVGNQATWKYRAMQLFKLASNGTSSVPLGAVVRVSPAVILDSGTAQPSTLSSIVSSATVQPGTSSGYSIPTQGTAYNYVSFHFHADGSTDLLPSYSLWFLTYHNASYGNSLAQPPADYATVQIDPLNGKVTTYRP